MATAKKSVVTEQTDDFAVEIAALVAARDIWARTSIAERITVLNEIKDALLPVAEGWAEIAARQKLIPAGSHLIGEEWTSGPYAVMSACNGLLATLSQMDSKKFLKNLPKRTLTSGQLAVKTVPNSIWDRLLLSGIRAEVWMQHGITADSLADHAALAYDTPPAQRKGKVALVLGAGNIAAIAPLDCFQKLFLENQVVILKMNPVNDYLTDYLQATLKPLIDRDALRIVRGDGAAGAALTNHPDIEEIHITGAGSTHDAIVWGVGAKGKANKKAGTPINARRVTSELGAVCPTIVVPGPWNDADIRFQGEHIATQKLHNSGFNCVACQALILPDGWDKTEALMDRIKRVISRADPRLAYYPGTETRLQDFADHGDNVVHIDRGRAPDLVVAELRDGADAWFENTEVFAPALSTHRISETDPEKYLVAAISYANDNLYGTLGGNILIHPSTIRQIGKKRFEQILVDFRYGHIAINAWTGLGFLLVQTPWGAFPGHTPQDVQSGIGTVHNTYMLKNTERTVVRAPFRPFPRSVLAGELTLLPKPPWFINNRQQHKIGKGLTRFHYKPGWSKLPGLFWNALRG